MRFRAIIWVMTSFMVGLLLVLLLLAFPYRAESQSHSQKPSPQDEAARAGELIKLAREAIGSEENLNRIQTLRASGKYNRFVKYVSVQSPKKIEEKQKILSGKMKFEFALPGKFRRRVTGKTMRDYPYSFAQVVSGDQAWRDPPARAVSSSGDRRVIDVSDVERSQFMQATGARQQLSFYSIGWLMDSLPGYPLQMRYLGLYQLGPENAHAIIAEGETGFRFTVLLDTKTYAPLALIISFVAEIQPLVMVDARGFYDRRFMRDTYMRAGEERRARAKPAQPCEMLIRFSERRPVDGVTLPFRVTTTVNGEVVEEMLMSKFEINRPIDLKKFAGPPESKD